MVSLAERHRQVGFTYLAALFLILIMGVMLGAVGKIWSTAQQRENERELLFVGAQFREAIGKYYQGATGAEKAFPERLDDLLQDPRHVAVRRHLRKIYRDPMTGTTQWGLVVQNGRIAGVYSLSQLEPLKTGNFDKEDQAFENAKDFSDWKFVYTPK